MNVTSAISNKRILLALGMIVFVAAIVTAGTGAFFSDTETSTGNTFTAGSIDLMVGNSSYVTDNNGDLVRSSSTSWSPGSLEGQLFFDFHDLKPGDVGEDTITINVDDNDAWACFAGSIEETPENEQTGPEAEVDDSDGANEGELQDELMFAVWADDGDNVFEDDEDLLQLGGADGPFVTAAQLAAQGSQPLADSNYNMFSENGTPLTGATEYHIGKAWCYGEMSANAVAQDEETTGNPVDRGTGFSCDGGDVDNASQSDGVKSSLAFHAVQSRNNDDFTCSSWEPEFDGGDGGSEQPEVGAVLSDYSAPECTVTVGDDETHTTIQGGVDSLNGDTGVVCVEDGTYEERVDTGGPSQTIVALNPQGAVIDGGVRLLHPNATVQGFEILGTTNTAGVGGNAFGVYVADDDATVANNAIAGDYEAQVNNQGIVTQTNAGIEGPQFINNVITGFHSGIYINPGASNALVKWNDLNSNTVGMSNDNPDSTTVTLNDIRSNTYEGMGLLVESGDSISVNDNNITLNASDSELNNYGSETFDATNNWWGDADGSDDTSQNGTGVVTFDPEAVAEFSHR